MPTFAEALDCLSSTIFISTTPENQDFTDLSRSASLVIMADLKGENLRVDIPLPKESKQLKETLGGISYHISRPDVTVIAWNIKSFFSFLTGRQIGFEFLSKVYDLRPMERFNGLDEVCPKTFHEAKVRLGRLYRSSSWEKLHKVYQKVHLPLSTRVVPAMEACGMVDRSQKKVLYGHYDIEGQANGRLRCSKSFARGFSPHNLTPLDRDSFRASMPDYTLLYFDFKHMEATVLQWLSRDDALGELLDQDLYAGIWEKITGLACTEKFRETCKNLFLPVIYGAGWAAIAKSLEVSENTAKKLVRGIYKAFPVSTSWASQCQTSIQNDGSVFDYFGRCRNFKTDFYKIRNYCVQAPASVICLNKLVKLYELVKNNKEICKLVFHLHDGYGIMVDKRNWYKIGVLAKEVLEAEDDLAPGLRLKITCKKGDCLGKMEKIDV